MTAIKKGRHNFCWFLIGWFAQTVECVKVDTGAVHMTGAGGLCHLLCSCFTKEIGRQWWRVAGVLVWLRST